MLAMPAIWLVWSVLDLQSLGSRLTGYRSILAYIACIMAFMWRIRPEQPDIAVPPQIGPGVDAAFRIFICCVFGIGVIYAILIVNTLRYYGSRMDRKWAERVGGFRRLHMRSRLQPLRHGTEALQGTVSLQNENNLSSTRQHKLYSVIPSKFPGAQATSSTLRDTSVKLPRAPEGETTPPAPTHVGVRHPPPPMNIGSAHLNPSQPPVRFEDAQKTDPTSNGPDTEGRPFLVHELQVIPPTPATPWN